MKIIKAGYEILSPINRTEILNALEIAGTHNNAREWSIGRTPYFSFK